MTFDIYRTLELYLQIANKQIYETLELYFQIANRQWNKLPIAI